MPHRSLQMLWDRIHFADCDQRSYRVQLGSLFMLVQVS